MGRLPEDGGDELGAVFAEINITPLTDIFLVLLIIFMVGAAMAVDAASGAGPDRSGVQIELPRGAAKDLAAAADDVTVGVIDDGRVLLDGAEVDTEGLSAGLAALQARRPGATVIVQADAEVAHARVVEVMEAARAAGFTRLAVATRGE